jgi:hypothetical protein
MFKNLFLLTFVLLFAACQTDKHNSITKTIEVTDTIQCCQNLEQDTTTYQPWLNGETMLYLGGHFEGLINNEKATGFASFHQEEDNSIHLILSYWNEKTQKLNGNLILDGKLQPNKALNFKDFKVFYNYSVSSCIGINFHTDSTKNYSSFLKYNVIKDKNRANGCLSFTLYKGNDNNSQEANLPDSIEFKNIRFSAILK